MPALNLAPIRCAKYSKLMGSAILHFAVLSLSGLDPTASGVFAVLGRYHENLLLVALDYPIENFNLASESDSNLSFDPLTCQCNGSALWPKFYF
ncbi:MAG: hypothetical protein ACI95C_001124 [Pseudohongiellaceae bacterium]